jgi:hypothetical protein
MKVPVPRARRAPANAVLASNTSADRGAGPPWATRARDRLALGVAAARDAMAEIVYPQTSSAQRIVTSRAPAAGPIVVRDFPTQWGLRLNRVYFAMLREAQRVVDEGIATRELGQPADGRLLRLAGRSLRDGEARPAAGKKTGWRPRANAPHRAAGACRAAGGRIRGLALPEATFSGCGRIRRSRRHAARRRRPPPRLDRRDRGNVGAKAAAAASVGVPRLTD